MNALQAEIVETTFRSRFRFLFLKYPFLSRFFSGTRNLNLHFSTSIAHTEKEEKPQTKAGPLPNNEYAGWQQCSNVSTSKILS